MLYSRASTQQIIMVKNLIKNSRHLLNRRQNSILSAASVLMVTVLLSRLLGLLRDRFLAGTFFADKAWQLDVYFAAFRLPDMIFQLLVVGALSAAFIPVFTQYIQTKKHQAWHIASSVITIGLVLFVLLGLVLFIFAAPLNQLIAPSFTPLQLALMTRLTRLLILAQASFLVSNFITGILQSHQHFLIPALSPLAYNLGIIFGILVLSPLIGIYGPVIGVILGAFLHLLVQLPLVKRIGFHYRPSFDIKHPGVRRIGRLMLPRTLALAVSQIELTVAVFIATSLSPGSLAIFYFAQHLNALPVGLFGATIGQAALPSLSRQQNSASIDKFKQLFLSSFNQILYFSLPASMILLVLRIPMVRLAFGARGFPWQATLLTGKVVAFFAISVFAQAVIQILVRAFYALANTRTPLVLGTLAVILNVCLSFVFVYQFNLSILGLALAISLASFFHAGLLLFYLNRAVNGFDKRVLLTPFFKMALATALTGLALWLPLRILDRYVLNTAKTFQLLILTLITLITGLITYLALSKLLKINQYRAFFTLFRRLRNFPKLLSHTETA